jgi:hypothetical protein
MEPEEIKKEGEEVAAPEVTETPAETTEAASEEAAA